MCCGHARGWETRPWPAGKRERLCATPRTRVPAGLPSPQPVAPRESPARPAVALTQRPRAAHRRSASPARPRAIAATCDGRKAPSPERSTRLPQRHRASTATACSSSPQRVLRLERHRAGTATACSTSPRASSAASVPPRQRPPHCRSASPAWSADAPPQRPPAAHSRSMSLAPEAMGCGAAGRRRGAALARWL